ncbi:hypothetical protein [Tautonia rosea]|uniref:hypothetical protein n=1 Tax=Tautonia rosea TaxID=2728037 RepID=UPI001475FB1C|nr:hypothetical protein [Tautonia rosea]
MPFIQSEAANPAIHDKAIRIAQACTEIIRPLLRQEEIAVACNEFYMAARAVLESDGFAQNAERFYNRETRP